MMMSDANANRRWRAVGRSLILIGAGIFLLVLVVFPMYKAVNQPKPPLQASGEILGVVAEDSAGTNPSLRISLDAEPPVDDSTSTLSFSFSLDAAAEETTLSVSIFLQGRLADAYRTCNQGTSSATGFNEFDQPEKNLTYTLLRDMADDSSLTQRDLAEQASSMEFARISHSVSFEAASGTGSNGRYFTLECVMDSGYLWNKVSGTYWDVTTPTAGLRLGGLQSDSGPSSRSTLSTTLSVSRGEQLFYQEGYPAPSTRDQESDSFTETANTTYGYGDGDRYTLTEPINARYSDTVAESQSGDSAFLAGVLAGLFASFIGAGVLGLFDELLRIRIAADVDPEQIAAAIHRPSLASAARARWAALRSRSAKNRRKDSNASTR